MDQPIPTNNLSLTPMRRTIPQINPIRLFLLLVSLILVWWYAAAIRQIDRSTPELIVLSEVSFEVGSGKTVTLGRRDLGQAPGSRSALQTHLIFLNDGQELRLQKLADRKRLDLKFIPGERSVYSNRYPIPKQNEGIVEVVLGQKTLQIERTGPDQITTIIEGPNGPLKTILWGDGRVVTNGKKLNAWCNDDTGWGESIEQNLVWPFRQFSWILSESNWVPNQLRDSNARRIAHFGGAMNCRLASNAALIQLPGAHEELELGIRRFFDDGKIRYYVHSINIPPNAPITYRTLLKGQEKNIQTQYDRLDWEVHTSGEVLAHQVTGFTAGYTDYEIEVKKKIATSGENVKNVGWRVSLRPTKRAAYFTQADCVERIGQWTDKGMSRKEQDALIRCPGPSREENRKFKFQHNIVGSPIERLFAFGRIDFIGTDQHGDPVLSSGVLKIGEKLAYAVLACVTLIMLLISLIRQPESGIWQGSIRATILAIAFFVQAFQLSILLTNWWSVETTPFWLFYSSIAMLTLACFAAWLDNDGGVLSQLLTIVIFALMLVGGITLFSLSAGGGTADLERYFIKHKAFLLDFMPAMWIIACLSSGIQTRTILGRSIIDTDRWYSPFKFVPFVLLIVFISWLLIGTQEGLLGFQPVELGKFIVVLGLGAILAREALKMRLSSGLRTRGVTMGIAIVVFTASLIVVPALKSDVSPIIVVVGCLFTLVLFEMVSIAIRIRREREADQAEIRALPTALLPPKSHGMRRRIKLLPWFAAILVFLIFASALLVTNRYVTPKNFSVLACPSDQVFAAKEALGEGRRLIVERLMNWADMRYDRADMDQSYHCEKDSPGQITLGDRDLAQQGLRSRSAIAHAPCNLSPAFHVGPVALVSEMFRGSVPAFLDPCPPDSGVMPTINCDEKTLKAPVVANCIPVVESDFIGAFVIANHGLSAGIMLVSIQFAFIVIGLFIYSSLKSGLVDEPLVRGAQDILATSALGVTLLFTIQWTLAWGNTFVLLPIMGQPMTWISAATSHHLFMALPASLMLLMAARTSQLRQNTIPFGQHP